MTNFELYMLLSLVAIIWLSVFYIFYIVVFVTPRVDKYNGVVTGSAHVLKIIQASHYMLAFNASDFVKSTKLYSNVLSHYKAEPRDIFYFKCYRYTLHLGMIALLIASFLVWRWES